MDNKFQKLKIALEYELLGMGFHKALKAFNLARTHHKKLRKDGKTHEFQHQLEIAHYVLTLKGVKNLENVLCAVLLHDISEDYEIENKYIREHFGDEVADAVEALTKKFKGNKKDYSYYFEELAKNEIASVVKGADRMNNIQSMMGVFTKEKQLSYVQEVETYFLPMLKEARKTFTEQSYAYLNMEYVLKNYVMFVKQVNKDK